MIQIDLANIPLRKILARRGKKENVARFLDGILVPIEGQATEFLENIKIKFPNYTRHGIQHSDLPPQHRTQG